MISDPQLARPWQPRQSVWIVLRFSINGRPQFGQVRSCPSHDWSTSGIHVRQRWQLKTSALSSGECQATPLTLFVDLQKKS